MAAASVETWHADGSVPTLQRKIPCLWGENVGDVDGWAGQAGSVKVIYQWCARDDPSPLCKSRCCHNRWNFIHSRLVGEQTVYQYTERNRLQKIVFLWDLVGYIPDSGPSSQPHKLSFQTACNKVLQSAYREWLAEIPLSSLIRFTKKKRMIYLYSSYMVSMTCGHLKAKIRLQLRRNIEEVHRLCYIIISTQWAVY